MELTVPWEERCQSAYEIKEPSTPTYKLCKELVDGKLGCSCRGWLSRFSSKISVDNIEFPRHTRVVGNNTELQWKRSDKLQKEHLAGYGSKETRRTENYPMRGSDPMFTIDLPPCQAESVLGFKDRNTMWRTEPSWWSTSCGCAECCFNHAWVALQGILDTLLKDGLITFSG